MFRSIQWRIAIPYVVLILISMAVLGYYLIDFVRDTRIDDLRSQLEEEALLIAEVGAHYLAEHDSAELDGVARNLGDQIEARVTIIAEDGTVLGDSHEDPTTMENHSARPEVRDALASGFGESRRHSTTIDRRMMYVAVPIVIDGHTAGVARVAIPTGDIDSSVGQLQRSIGVAMGIMTVIAVIVALYIARVTTRPIKALTRAAKRIAYGQLDQNIYPESRGETAELATAFNEMSGSLKKMVGDLTTEKNKLAAVLSGMADGVVMTDIMGTVLMANQAVGKMFSFNASQATGHRLAELIPDHEANDLLKAYLRTGQQQAGQIEQPSQGRLLRVIVSPISYHNAVGALLIFQDLSKVRRLQTLRQRFVGNISHELRTPLASMKAVVETLREGALDNKPVAEDFLRRMDNDIDRMTQMVRELSELSRIETGQIELELAPLDLETVIDDAIDALLPQAERKGISIHKQLPPDLPAVLAEDERILQVITNLLHNAIKFTPADGKVTISAHSDATTAIVSIADTGPGILPDDLPHVFERFYKADKARSTMGTGLGLAIAKHIVQAHGGEIWAESEPDQGSTFSFKLPTVPGK